MLLRMAVAEDEKPNKAAVFISGNELCTELDEVVGFRGSRSRIQDFKEHSMTKSSYESEHVYYDYV